VSETSVTSRGLHLGKSEGQAYWLLTDLLTFKAVGKETNGALAIVEVATGPDPGPPPHIHRNCDESFYILEGTFEFTLDGRAFTADTGSFVYLPKGIVHTHQALKGTRARALTLQTPAGIEHFVEEVGEPATDPSKRPAVTPAGVERVLGLAPKHGIDVPGHGA
jgi:quercetin dioxygenase-like cupin family protein